MSCNMLKVYLHAHCLRILPSSTAFAVKSLCNAQPHHSHKSDAELLEYTNRIRSNVFSERDGECLQGGHDDQGEDADGQGD